MRKRYAGAWEAEGRGRRVTEAAYFLRGVCTLKIKPGAAASLSSSTNKAVRDENGPEILTRPHIYSRSVNMDQVTDTMTCFAGHFYYDIQNKLHLF